MACDLKVAALEQSLSSSMSTSVTQAQQTDQLVRAKDKELSALQSQMATKEANLQALRSRLLMDAHGQEALETELALVRSQIKNTALGSATPSKGLVNGLLEQRLEGITKEPLSSLIAVESVPLSALGEQMQSEQMQSEQMLREQMQRECNSAEQKLAALQLERVGGLTLFVFLLLS